MGNNENTNIWFKIVNLGILLQFLPLLPAVIMNSYGWANYENKIGNHIKTLPEGDATR